MLAVVETLLFQKQWPHYWSEEERGEFAVYIANHPEAGDVVPGSGGFERSDGAAREPGSPGAFA